jgi:Mrp family chromosome partitioning ATPase
LLKNGRFETFLEEVSPLYDMIIIDTAPILLVTDTITIAKYCDLLVYLTKAGHTDKNLLQVPVDLVKDQKVANIGIILNAVGENESYGYGYGYNYGYGYGYKEQQKKKKWYHFKSNS